MCFTHVMKPEKPTVSEEEKQKLMKWAKEATEG